MLAACTPAGGDTIKIGVCAPLSGPVPTFGVSTRDGVLLAIEQANAKGGVLGKKLEAVVTDSQCTADPAVNAMNKLADQDKVKYVIGEVCSSASIPMSEIAEKKGIVMISPTSTNPSVTVKADGSAKQFVFRACFIDPFQGTVMAKFALEKKFKTAFVMFDKGNDYVLGLGEFFEKAFVAGGGQIVGKEAYTGKDTDFSAILSKVASSKAEVLFLPDYYNVVNLVARQAKDKGVTSVMMGGDGWDSSDLDRKIVTGFYSNHYFPGDTRPIVQNWLKDYNTKYKKDKDVVPDALATLGYDATNLMIEAIKKAGADDAAKVKDAMAALSFEAVSGKVTFDKSHNPIKSAVVIEVKDGKDQYAATVNP